MLLFNDAVTLTLIISGVSTYMLVTTLFVMGIVPNAPLFITSAHPDTHEKLFNAMVMLFLSVPYLIAFMLGAYLLVRYWQSREDGVRRAGLTDSLTDMANRRAINNHLEDLLSQRNESTPISVILVDIDYFKSVNDTYGHATGDLVLRRVGDSLKASLRGDDQVGRFGGEEFLIVLPNTPLDIAEQIAERCRLQIEQTIILNQDHKPIRVTASFGVYCSIEHDEDLPRILHAADVQLYRAKDSGRNRVCVHGELLLA
jgi:diguanylate cyclase (GGDEF)-like protein